MQVGALPRSECIQRDALEKDKEGEFTIDDRCGSEERRNEYCVA